MKDDGIAVTGATGFVGRHVVRALLGAGFDVRALVRDREKAKAALPGGAAWVIGDIGDRRALADLTRGCTGLVHCVGIRREFPPEVTFEKSHPLATSAAIDAARSAGAGRFVLISALGTRPDARASYHRSKYASELLVRQSGLEWTILRPSLIHGPDGEFMRMAKSWAMGRSAPFVAMPWFARVGRPAGFPPVPKPESSMIQPVFVEDVAAAVVASLRGPGAIGEVYPLAGPEALDWPTLLAAVRDALPLADRKKRIIPLPGVLASAAARAAEILGLGAALPFGPSEPIMAIEDNTCALDKALEHLGLAPQAFSNSLREYARRI